MVAESAGEGAAFLGLLLCLRLLICDASSPERILETAVAFVAGVFVDQPVLSVPGQCHRPGAEKTRIRNEVNAWIRTAAPFDGVIDFSQVVHDPADPDRLLPPLDCGDGIHPSVMGYYEMGRAVDLELFRAPR